MAKRSNFEKIPRDLYKTPAKAIPPLLDYLKKGTKYAEPCAGDGQLVRLLDKEGMNCMWASDIKPTNKKGTGLHIYKNHFADLTGFHHMRLVRIIITNPPWSWDKIVALFGVWLQKWKKPMWLLLPSDWAYNKRTQRYMAHCVRVVPVGRIQWVPGSEHQAMDNVAWYLFDPGKVQHTILERRKH